MPIAKLTPVRGSGRGGNTWLCRTAVIVMAAAVGWSAGRAPAAESLRASGRTTSGREAGTAGGGRQREVIRETSTRGRRRDAGRLSTQCFILNAR